MVGEGTPEVLLVPQWEGLASLTEKPTLPSFLYLPEEAVAAHLRGEEVGARQWIVGLFARMKASEAPGRVVHSAKSWLCHHAADRSAPFLPWGSTVAGGRLSGPQWDQLVAACRHLKEHALAATGPLDERFVVALAGRGSGMVGGSQTATMTRGEIESLLLDGFFPFCDAAVRTYRTHAALREWGLWHEPHDARVSSSDL